MLLGAMRPWTKTYLVNFRVDDRQLKESLRLTVLPIDALSVDHLDIRGKLVRLTCAGLCAAGEGHRPGLA